jgi:hypothetical protein
VVTAVSDRTATLTAIAARKDLCMLAPRGRSVA